MPDKPDADPPTEAEFEEWVDALLKVDPEGITGQSEKHRKKADES